MARHSTARSASATRRLAAVVLAVVGVAGLSLASAAQLDVSSGPLNAGTGIVASCQTSGPISVGFTSAWTTALNPDAYGATKVTLSGVDSACGGMAYRISVLNGSGAALTEVTGTVPTGGGDVPSSTFGAIAVTSIVSVAVVIHG